MMRLDGIIWYQWLHTKNNIIDSAVGIGAIGAFIGLYIGVILLISVQQFWL